MDFINNVTNYFLFRKTGPFRFEYLWGPALLVLSFGFLTGLLSAGFLPFNSATSLSFK
jgi:hypothetical protein